MTPSPAPGMVSDWLTWPFVSGCVFLVFLVWLTLVILLPREHYPSVNWCDRIGHTDIWVGVWRCSHCGAERNAEGVYDQDAA